MDPALENLSATVEAAARELPRGIQAAASAFLGEAKPKAPRSRRRVPAEQVERLQRLLVAEERDGARWWGELARAWHAAGQPRCAQACMEQIHRMIAAGSISDPRLLAELRELDLQIRRQPPTASSRAGRRVAEEGQRKAERLHHLLGMSLFGGPEQASTLNEFIIRRGWWHEADVVRLTGMLHHLGNPRAAAEHFLVASAARDIEAALEDSTGWLIAGLSFMGAGDAVTAYACLRIWDWTRDPAQKQQPHSIESEGDQALQNLLWASDHLHEHETSPLLPSASAILGCFSACGVPVYALSYLDDLPGSGAVYGVTMKRRHARHLAEQLGTKLIAHEHSGQEPPAPLATPRAAALPTIGDRTKAADIEPRHVLGPLPAATTANGISTGLHLSVGFRSDRPQTPARLHARPGELALVVDPQDHVAVGDALAAQAASQGWRVVHFRQRSHQSHPVRSARHDVILGVPDQTPCPERTEWLRVVGRHGPLLDAVGVLIAAGGGASGGGGGGVAGAGGAGGVGGGGEIGLEDLAPLRRVLLGLGGAPEELVASGSGRRSQVRLLARAWGTENINSAGRVRRFVSRMEAHLKMLGTLQAAACGHWVELGRERRGRQPRRLRPAQVVLEMSETDPLLRGVLSLLAIGSLFGGRESAAEYRAPDAPREFNVPISKRSDREDVRDLERRIEYAQRRSPRRSPDNDSGGGHRWWARIGFVDVKNPPRICVVFSGDLGAGEAAAIELLTASCSDAAVVACTPRLPGAATLGRVARVAGSIVLPPLDDASRTIATIATGMAWPESAETLLVSRQAETATPVFVWPEIGG